MRDYLTVAIAVIVLAGCAATQHHQHAGEFDWAIQGIYSQLDCANQPGTRPYYVDSGDHWFFLECR